MAKKKTVKKKSKPTRAKKGASKKKASSTAKKKVANSSSQVKKIKEDIDKKIAGRAEPSDTPLQKKPRAELGKKKESYGKTSIQSKFDKKNDFKKRRMDKIFSEFLEKAGLEISPKVLHKRILFTDLTILIVMSLTTIVTGILLESKLRDILALLLQTWTIVFVGVYLLSLLLVFFYLDIRIYNRTQQIEEVLPDFLQLASANISAGMTVDRALWFAVRPRFGVLAKEIEEIAKATIAGEDLTESLLAFTKKYDSKILRESVNLIVAGIRSGGEIGDLLNKISENILDTKLMKKEVSASVTTYVIFIGVASVLAAPALFALSGQLLIVIQSIAETLSGASGGGAGGASSALSISFGTDSISLKDFKIFSIVLISITCYFAAAIISVIRKGDSSDALKNFPLFLVVAMGGFFFMSWLLGILLGGLF